MTDTENLLKLADSLEWKTKTDDDNAPVDGSEFLMKESDGTVHIVHWYDDWHDSGWKSDGGFMVDDPAFYMPIPDGKAAEAIRALAAERDAYREALDHTLSAISYLRDLARDPTKENITQWCDEGDRFIKQALTRTNELAGNKINIAIRGDDE